MMGIRNIIAESVELLKDMVAIKSPSFEEDAVCSHICEWMSQKGIIHRRIGNNIVAEHITDAEKPVLMLCAHIDTVSPSPDYSFDPYNPDYEKAAEVISSILERPVKPDEIVAGLGSNDDGASVVTMIAAYRYFTERHIESPDRTLKYPDSTLESVEKHPNLILVLTCEEERSGKNGMTGLWPELSEKVTHAIIGEPTGMKCATSERGLLVIDAEAYGKSGHAARNEGTNALYIALEDIEKLRKHQFTKISPRMGKVNLNVTQINAGTAHNVIPDRCTFVIDIRPTEQYTNEEILEELQSICRSTLKPRNLLNRSSATYEHSQLQRAVEELGIETFSSPTTSDWMRVGCDAIKMGPGESQRSHRKDEFVTIEEIEKGINTIINTIKTFN
jgi:acetylornithine deacetylase